MVDLIVGSSVGDILISALSDENVRKNIKKESLEELDTLFQDSKDRNKEICISHRLLKVIADAAENKFSYSDVVLKSRILFPKSAASPVKAMVCGS